MNSSHIQLCLVLHNHQPIGNFDGVFEDAYQDSYLPFLDVFEPFTDLNISLHTSGPLMQWLQKNHPEYLNRISQLVEVGRIEIIGGAFTPAACLGVLIGVMIQGFQRGAFSNEAGTGSAAIAHSAVKTKYPASEGIVALLEPFIDTVVICTMTALVIVIFNSDAAFAWGDVEAKKVLIDGVRVGGVDLTSRAFDSVLPGFRYVLTIAIILFAFSTMISWSYYGLQSWKFLFGKGQAADLTYKILFCVVVVIGSAISLGSVIDFSDAMIFAMVFPNMIGLFLLFPKVRQELRRYLAACASKNEG